MRVYRNSCIAVLVAAAFAIPVWAHEESASLILSKPATIEQKALKPGDYKFVANTGTKEVRVMRRGRVVATVPGKWITLQSKSPYNAVVLNKRQIREIDFSGKTQAVRLE